MTQYSASDLRVIEWAASERVSVTDRIAVPEVKELPYPYGWLLWTAACEKQAQQ
jgi:hypothetical protein